MTTTHDHTPRAAAFPQRYRESADALCAWMHIHLQPALEKRLCADDLVQETWCRAYQAYRRYDPERASFRAWLLGIAEKVLQEELRRLTRNPIATAHMRSSLVDKPAEVVAELTSISERAARSEWVQELVDMAAGLTEEERQILLYRGIEEVGYEELAQRLGLGADAARGRWRRLQERCRQRLRRFDVSLDSLR